MKKTLLTAAVLVTYSTLALADAPTTALPTTAIPNTTVTTIDCNYHIGAQTIQVDEAIISQWSEKATKQSFDFTYNNIDKELELLKGCFTDEGWKGFNDALAKSGNIAAIKAQKLIVNSTVEGKASVTGLNNNQWKVQVPMQVLYKNDKEKLNQSLMVDLLVGRKITGDLGIMQIVVAPRDTSASPAASPTEAAKAPNTSPINKPASQ